MQKTAVFPGSFDPFTIGHYDIVKRGLPLFDKLIIAIGVNSQKQYFFSSEKRIEMLSVLFKDEKKIAIKEYEGLTIDFCRSEGANYILRGLRTSADFEFERGIAQMNSSMAPEIETVFIISQPQFSHVNSTIVREILKYGGDVNAFLPQGLNLKL